jgi:adenylate cyclase, class 2
MREIEVRIRLENDQKTELLKWLEEKAVFKGDEEHLEYYLNNPNETFFYQTKQGFKDAKDYMRVRFSEKGDSVCLKRFEIDLETSKSKNIDEIEYKVSSGEESLKLFEAVGFTEKTKVSKRRKKYDYKNFEVVLDEVEGLGFFAEVEIKNFPETVDIKEGYKEIRKFIFNDLGFKSYLECNRGYLSFLWNPEYNFTEIRTEI